MSEFKPDNFEPIHDVIEHVRKLKRPSGRNKYCKQLEDRFWFQDWMTQIDICSLWLDIDNSYTRNYLFYVLIYEYWDLLQKLVRRGEEKAEALSTRIMDYSIDHISDEAFTIFITAKAPIEVVRKYRKQLEWLLPGINNHRGLAMRLGGDRDFIVDKDKFSNRLDYFEICAKHHLPTTDEEAIDELKRYIQKYADYIDCTLVNVADIITEVKFSLRLSSSIDKWRRQIEALGLTRAADAFDRWDAGLQSRINKYYEADSKYRCFPVINRDRLDYYWRYFIEMAIADISSIVSSDDYIDRLVGKYPEMEPFIKELNLKLDQPLEL